jgi:REP element-mobilizing transposase RayT
MTQPRSQLMPVGASGAYHCVQRCVRRAFLCGIDDYTGRSFEHRKQWLEERIHLVAGSFAVSIHAYAVMSNHLHLVVQVDPSHAERWSDADVTERWLRLFPPRDTSDEARARKSESILANTHRLAIIRARLGNLSWFMRCLAEPIARRANREDGCRGRFWEGRFKSQLLCDERALLAAMAYVDLNPIRAGIAKTLQASRHTSAARRIAETEQTSATLNGPLQPIAGALSPKASISTSDYLTLLDWTGRQIAPGKKGLIRENVPHVIRLLDARPERWTTRVKAVGSGYWRVIGECDDLVEIAKRLGLRWVKGVGLAARLASSD